MGLAQEFRDFFGSILAFPGDFYGSIFGLPPSESGVTVNELSSLQIATVATCVRFISNQIATIPLNVYEVMSDGSHRVVPNHDFYYLLHDAPNNEMSAADFKESGQAHALLQGNGYIEIVRNGAGQPAEFWLRSPWRTFPYRTATGELIYKTTDTASGSERVIPAINISQIKGLGLDPLVGLSPIRYFMREVLGIDIASQAYSAKYFANASVPSGVLKNPAQMRPDQKLQAITAWLEATSRSNFHKPAILDGGLTWEQIGVDPQEAQLLELRQFNRSQICAVYGVAEHFAGGHEDTKANLEQRSLECLTFTIKPWCRKWEQALNPKLFPRVDRNSGRYFCKFDTSALERATYADLLKGVQMGRYAGLYTGQEGRKLLGENPYSKEQLESKNPADKLLMPVNMVFVTPDLLEPEPKPASTDPNAGEEENPSESDSEAEKKSLKLHFRQFWPQFRDAFGRILNRKKRDAADFKRVFSPVIIGIASAFEFNPEIEPGDMAMSGENLRFVTSYIEGLQHRAENWTAEKADQQATEELIRAIKELRKNVISQKETEEDEA